MRRHQEKALKNLRQIRMKDKGEIIPSPDPHKKDQGKAENMAQVVECLLSKCQSPEFNSQYHQKTTTPGTSGSHL
jgi:hypothetical protein